MSGLCSTEHTRFRYYRRGRLPLLRTALYFI
nr:MAG TPA: hypothetical protein [Caudoviricetes sp.]